MDYARMGFDMSPLSTVSEEDDQVRGIVGFGSGIGNSLPQFAELFIEN